MRACVNELRIYSFVNVTYFSVTAVDIDVFACFTLCRACVHALLCLSSCLYMYKGLSPCSSTAPLHQPIWSDIEVCMIREFPWVPWESHGNGKHRLNLWEWEWEWWTRNGREMGIVAWKKFPLVALIIFLALYFSSLSAGSLNNLLFLHSSLA